MEESIPFVGSQKRNGEGIGVRNAVCYVVGVFGVVPFIVIPGAIVFCGPLGFLLLAVLIIASAYTAILLGRSWLTMEVFWPHEAQINRRHPYPALAEKTGGLFLRRIVYIFQNLDIFGGSLPFLLIASENLQKFLYGISSGGISLSFCYYIVITTAVLVPILWIGTPKDLWHLSWLSAASILVCGTLVLIMLIRDAPDANEVTYPNLIPHWSTLAYCFGAIAFQFDIHSMILTVQMDMKEKSRVPIVLVVAFSIGFCIYGTVAFTAYYLFGDKIKANIFDNFVPGLMLYTAMLVVALQCTICLTLGINTLFQNIEESLGIPNMFCWRRVVIRTTILLLVLFVAMSIPHFAVAIELVGGLLVAPYIFMFPPLFYITIKYKASGQLAIKDLLFGTEIVLIGIIGSIGATIESGIEVSLLPSFAPPCYINFATAYILDSPQNV